MKDFIKRKELLGKLLEIYKVDPFIQSMVMSSMDIAFVDGKIEILNSKKWNTYQKYQ